MYQIQKKKNTQRATEMNEKGILHFIAIYPAFVEIRRKYFSSVLNMSEVY